MAVTTAVLSGNVADLTGTADPKVLKAASLSIESNTTDSALLDTAGSKIMVGIEPVTIDATTGAFTVTLVRTDSTDIVPAAGRMYRAHLDYRTPHPNAGRKRITSGWFTFTANAGLASKWTGIETILVPTTANLNDTAMTNVDASAASAFRVQQDARLSATYVPKSLTSNPVPNSTTLRTITGPRTAQWRESFARGNVTEGATTLENMTWGWGFNMAPNYTKEVSTEPMFRIGMESSWLNAGVVYSELHLGAFIDPSSPTPNNEIRPIGVAVKHGGDGGKGSPSISFTISDTSSASSLSVYNVAGTPLLEFGSSAWYFRRNLNVHRGSSGPSLLTVGDALHDASLVLDAKAAGGVNQIELKRGGVSTWLWYDGGTVGDFYFRDTTNSRMHMTFIKGATAAAAYTDIDSNLRAYGNEFHIGPATSKAVIGALSGVEAWFDAQGSGPNVGVSIRAKGTGVIKALSAFQAQGNIGFYNATPVAKPTISGSRGGNAALASLLTALASQGLLTDSSTA